MSKNARRVVAGALLLAERRTQRQLREAARESVDGAVADATRRHEREGAAALLLMLAMWSRRMAAKAREALSAGRQAARRDALERSARQIRSVGIRLPDGALLAAHGRRHDVDDAHGHAAADSLAAQWRAQANARVMQALKMERDAARAIEQSWASMPYRIGRTAATETASAFNDELHRGLIDVAESVPELKSAFASGGLVRIWSSLLDMRVCPECAARDGKIIRGNDVPPLHPLCRCISVLEWSAQAAAA